MSKRFWGAVAAALVLAGGVHAQTDSVAPAAQPAEPIAPPVQPVQPAEPLAPIAGFARSLADSNIRVWGNVDYLFAFVHGAQLPPLVTTSPAGTAHAAAGILGNQSTALVFGGQRVDDNLRAGFRLAVGAWFDSDQTLGIEAGFLMTSSQAAIFSQASTDGTILARPFTDATTNLNQAVLVAFPGSSNGTIDIRANSGNLYGAHFDLAEKSYDGDGIRIYSLVGYRFFRYDEQLRVQQAISPTAAPFVPGTVVVSNDNFSTRNQFHGLDLGIRSQFAIRDSLMLEILAKVAVGRLHRDIDIGGNQTTIVPGAAPVTLPGGVLAVSSNSGSFAESDWRALPEIGVTLGWQIRPHVALRLGYSLIYFNAIARAGDQVDTMINPNLLPAGNAANGGPPRPAFNLTRTDMWLQAVNLGVEFTY